MLQMLFPAAPVSAQDQLSGTVFFQVLQMLYLL
jgi:hypothetical protein